MTRKAISVHIHMIDNREMFCDAENSCLSMSNIGRRCVTIKAVCMHVERREKFPRQLYSPLSMPAIICFDCSISLTSNVM